MPRARRPSRAVLAALLVACASGALSAACALDVAGEGGDLFDAGSDATELDADSLDAAEDATNDATGGKDASNDSLADQSAPDGGDDADATSDAGVDADAGDASLDAPPDGAGDAAVDDAGFACDGGTVSDCSQCAGATQPCVYCASDGGTTTSASCTKDGVHCNASIPSGYAMCGCAFPDASTCPLGTQVCHDGNDGKTCRSCGEPHTSGDQCMQGGTCGGGGTCN